MLDRVLALNVGSSSLKWSLFDATDEVIDEMLSPTLFHRQRPTLRRDATGLRSRSA